MVVTAVGGGFAYGALGMSHHATEDLAILRSLPEIKVIAPGDPLEAAAAVRAAAAGIGPVYLRLGRAGETNVHQEPLSWTLGKAITLRDGTDLTIISTGGMLLTAVQAADLLAKEGIAAGVLSMHTLKPLDTEAVLAAARRGAAAGHARGTQHSRRPGRRGRRGPLRGGPPAGALPPLRAPLDLRQDRGRSRVSVRLLRAGCRLDQQAGPTTSGLNNEDDRGTADSAENHLAGRQGLCLHHLRRYGLCDRGEGGARLLAAGRLRLPHDQVVLGCPRRPREGLRGRGDRRGPRLLAMAVEVAGAGVRDRLAQRDLARSAAARGPGGLGGLCPAVWALPDHGGQPQRRTRGCTGATPG